MPLHEGTRRAGNPVELMRSRYCAYSLGMVDYIVTTTLAKSAASYGDEKEWRASIEEFCSSLRFTGLRILDSSFEGERGEVTFRAGLARETEDHSFEERSEFHLTEEGWRYVGAIDDSAEEDLEEPPAEAP